MAWFNVLSVGVATWNLM